MLSQGVRKGNYVSHRNDMHALGHFIFSFLLQGTSLSAIDFHFFCTLYSSVKRSENTQFDLKAVINCLMHLFTSNTQANDEV